MSCSASHLRRSTPVHLSVDDLQRTAQLIKDWRHGLLNSGSDPYSVPTSSNTKEAMARDLGWDSFNTLRSQARDTANSRHSLVAIVTKTTDRLNYEPEFVRGAYAKLCECLQFPSDLGYFEYEYECCSALISWAKEASCLLQNDQIVFLAEKYSKITTPGLELIQKICKYQEIRRYPSTKIANDLVDLLAKIRITPALEFDPDNSYPCSGLPNELVAPLEHLRPEKIEISTDRKCCLTNNEAKQ